MAEAIIFSPPYCAVGCEPGARVEIYIAGNSLNGRLRLKVIGSGCQF